MNYLIGPCLPALEKTAVRSRHGIRGAAYGSLVVTILALAGSACSATPAMDDPGCAPPGYSNTSLLALRDAGFEIQANDDRSALAIALVSCLGSPDPAMRDGVAYGALSTWLRNELLNQDTSRKLRDKLLDKLASDSPDQSGFTRPFVVLVLAEVARVDRVSPFFDDSEREALVAAATTYMRSIDDYRGFDDEQGWRHGVAHAADLIMQLALNENIDASQLRDMRDALSTQIVPANRHSYIFGEPERLARPVLFMARRQAFSGEDWQAWFNKLANPAPFSSWDDIWSSERGLAKLHNTRAFAQAIYVNAGETKNEHIKALLPASLSLLKRLP